MFLYQNDKNKENIGPTTYIDDLIIALEGLMDLYCVYQSFQPFNS